METRSDTNRKIASGRFDVNSRKKKYDGILEALKTLIQSLLALGHDEYDVWSQKLLSMGYGNLSILSEFLPGISILTGIEAPKFFSESGKGVSELDFANAVTTLLSIISSCDIPVVLYLDSVEVVLNIL